MEAENVVLVFMKWPEAGKVKTRLAKDIGDKEAVCYYRQFVEDTVEVVYRSRAEEIICFSPEEKLEEFTAWLGHDKEYHAQCEGDLGVKLVDAFNRAFSLGYSKVIVIGTDSPHLPVEYLKDAFTALDSHDAVIGPSDDGGYYLLGLRTKSFDPHLFEEIAWSTETVFSETMKRFGSLGTKVFVLPEFYDIDTIEDLNRYKAEKFGK